MLQAICKVYLLLVCISCKLFVNKHFNQIRYIQIRLNLVNFVCMEYFYLFGYITILFVLALKLMLSCAFIVQRCFNDIIDKVPIVFNLMSIVKSVWNVSKLKKITVANKKWFLRLIYCCFKFCCCAHEGWFLGNKGKFINNIKICSLISYYITY